MLLSSCFSSQEENAPGTWLTLQDTPDFTISTPETWNTYNSELPKPRSWELVLALASNTERQWYLNNIVILKTTNTLSESAQSLMKNTEVGLKANLNAYVKIEEKNMNFINWDSGTLLIYDAKYNTSTPKLTYIQTAQSCGDDNYYMTISLSQKPENYDRYEYLLSTFACKE